MTGIEDVARASGVSISTVSRALRGLPNVSASTRELVRRAADELGYVASSSASGLATGRTMAMGVVTPTLSTWYYSTVVEGVDSVLRAANYDLILFNLGRHGADRDRMFHRSIWRKRTDAIVALCIDFTADERHQLATTGRPTMIVGGSVPGLPHVDIDEAGVARAATEHLIALGHRRISHLAGNWEAGLTRQVPFERRRGFDTALSAAGLPAREDWTRIARFGMAEARRIMRDDILADPADRPTAVFADSDEMAIGAILACHDLGLSVPRDLSVIGIDGHELAESFDLTTMAQEPFHQGALAARMLLDRLADPTMTLSSARYPVRLIQRGSTAAPRGR